MAALQPWRRISRLSSKKKIFSACNSIRRKAATLARKLLQNFLRLCRMSLARRIIPCLDTDGARVVKGVNFVGLRDAGDPGGTGGALQRRRR